MQLFAAQFGRANDGNQNLNRRSTTPGHGLPCPARFVGDGLALPLSKLEPPWGLKTQRYQEDNQDPNPSIRRVSS